MSKYQLNFTGDKEELHQMLKKWCEQENKIMNGTIISLIEKHLKDNKFATTLKEWKTNQ